MMHFSRKIVGSIMTAFCLFSAPVLAAPRSAAVSRITSAVDAFENVKNYQFDGKVDFSSILANGVLSFKGEGTQKPESRIKMSGSVSVSSLPGSITKEIPFQVYATQDDKNDTVYIRKNNEAWGKYVSPHEPGTDPAKKAEMLVKAIQSPHILSREGASEVILFRLDPNVIDAYTKKAAAGSTKAQGADRGFTKEEEKIINGALYEQDFMLTVNAKSKLPTRYEMDLSNLVQKTGSILLDRFSKEKGLDDSQKKMASQLLQTVRMNMAVNLSYHKGREIILPDEVKNAAEIKEPSPVDLAGAVSAEPDAEETQGAV